MTRFADDLFDDLMREHGPALAGMTVPTAAKRRLATRPVLLTAGAGGLAVAATVGTLTIGGAAPAYAVTPHSDGTVTLAVYQQPGIAQANAKLHNLGERVVVLPVKAGCPSINSLRPPRVPAHQISVEASGTATTSGGSSVTVNARGVPAGDILVVGVSTITARQGQVAGPGKVTSGGQVSGSAPGHAAAGSPAPGAVFSLGASRLTSMPVPSCISIPAVSASSLPPAGGAGSPAHCTRSTGPVTALPSPAQEGGSKSGSKVSGGCTVIGKAPGVAPAVAGVPAHGNG
jgi:hypothetical protein